MMNAAIIIIISDHKHKNGFEFTINFHPSLPRCPPLLREGGGTFAPRLFFDPLISPSTISRSAINKRKKTHTQLCVSRSLTAHN